MSAFRMLALGFALLAGAVPGQAQEPEPERAAAGSGSTSSDEAAIRRLLAEGYMAAVFVDRDETAVRRAFHPAFRMLVLDDEELLVVTLEEWLEHLELDGRRATERVEHRVTGVSVTGDAASARVEIRRDGKRIYSDHFLLYRLPDLGWRIVGKAFHDHD